MTRERQVSASSETANLSRQTLEHQRQYLDRAPNKGSVGLVLF